MKTLVAVAIVTVTVPLSSAAVPTTAVAAPPLKPGPHSFIGDVDLPEGSVQCATIACSGGPQNDDPQSEDWNYSTPYDDTVAFLRAQFK
jgi:hypothetical protein